MAVQRFKGAAVSNNEREFVVKAVRADHRADGRRAFEYRPIEFQFSLDDSSCIVRLGQTVAMASVSATLDHPYGDRPSEGSMRIDVRPPPALAMSPDSGPVAEDAVEMARLVERGLKESRAVDLEALCVLPGRRVWHLQVAVRVLDGCGNAADAAGMAALGALCAFRRPDVTVDADAPGGVTVHPIADREAVALTLHHLPLPVTFAFFDSGEVMAVDPSRKEEAAAAGGFTIVVNPHGEVCAAQKASGVGVAAAQVMQCTRVAVEKAKEVTEKLRKALAAHDVARVAARVRRRHAGGQPSQNAEAEGPMHGPAAGLLLKAAVGELQAADLDAVQLPEDIRKMVEHAVAPDSGSSDEEDEKSAEAGGNDNEMAVAEEEEAQEAATAGAAVGEDGERRGGSAGVGMMEIDAEERGGHCGSGATGEKKKPKRRKRRRSQLAAPQGDEGGDAYAAIADMILAAGGKEHKGQSSGGGGLEGALKNKK